MEGETYYKEYMAKKTKAREIHNFLKDKNKQKALQIYSDLVKSLENHPDNENWEDLLIEHKIPIRKM